MEDEKKKKNKKHKRKKNAQNKTGGENANATVVNGNGMNEHEHDGDQVSELVQVQNGALQQDAAADLNTLHRQNGAESNLFLSGNLAEAEKQQWLQREAVLKQTIRQLQDENDSHLQKEATLEETIKQLQNENNVHIEKKATLEDTVNQLRSINDSCLLKKAIFEESIKQLENENYSHEQKKADLEMEVKQLKSERDFWLQKEASLGDKIKQLETEKDSWIVEQNTAKETIAKLNVDITRLRMQVVELEECRNVLLKENQQLTESISGLQSQLQNPETSIPSADSSDEHGKHASEGEELNSQIEAAFALVDKLIMENSELVEKVNELYVKLERQDAAVGLLAAPGNNLMVGNAEIGNSADPNSVSNEKSVLGHTLDSLEVEPAALVGYSPEVDSGEIVQIPLDDSEAQDLESQVEGDDKDPVPLSDAPLIGAPFRLMSFFAKYVSGADLVQRSP